MRGYYRYNLGTLSLKISLENSLRQQHTSGGTIWHHEKTRMGKLSLPWTFCVPERLRFSLAGETWSTFKIHFWKISLMERIFTKLKYEVWTFLDQKYNEWSRMRVSTEPQESGGGRGRWADTLVACSTCLLRTSTGKYPLFGLFFLPPDHQLSG